MNLEQIKEVNYADLQCWYKENGIGRIGAALERMRSEDRGVFYAPASEETVRSGSVLFSPFRKILRFYGLLEIALIIKFIPEPNYDDTFWKHAAANLSLPFISEENYPVVLPKFLLGRLEGRSHLEEEYSDERYDTTWTRP